MANYNIGFLMTLKTTKDKQMIKIFERHEGFTSIKGLTLGNNIFEFAVEPSGLSNCLEVTCHWSYLEFNPHQQRKFFC